MIDDSKGTNISRNHSQVLVGVQWTPFKPASNRGFDGRAFALRAGLGGELVDGGEFDGTFGGVAQVSVSWLPAKGEDYEFGVELRGQTSYFAHGLEIGMAVLATVKMK